MPGVDVEVLGVEELLLPAWRGLNDRITRFRGLVDLLSPPECVQCGAGLTERATNGKDKTIR